MVCDWQVKQVLYKLYRSLMEETWNLLIQKVLKL